MLRDKIKAAKDWQVEAEKVPEWDCTVYLRTLSAGERLALEKLAECENRGQLLVQAVIAAARDEDGSPAFTEADAEWLVTKSSDVLMRLFNKILQQNKMRKEDLQDVKKP